MIDINLRFQFSMFGSYDDITPKPDTLKYFIDAFADKEIIPTTVQELDITNPLTPLNRLSLKSSDEVWSIDFKAKRIDIHKNNNDVGVVKMGDLNEFLEETKKIVRIIEEKFPKKHNRLALVTRYLFKQMTKEEVSGIFHKNFNSIEIFKQNEPVEWNNRVVTRVLKEISGEDEIINIIADLNRIKGILRINSKNEEIDRIELRLDINTYQGATDYRFGISELLEFISNANKLEDDLKTEYLGLL